MREEIEFWNTTSRVPSIFLLESQKTDELDKIKMTAAIRAVGIRAYNAARILMSKNGFGQVRAVREESIL